MPTRIQRGGDGESHLPKNAVYVGRPTLWVNPFTAAEAIADDPALTPDQASKRCERMYQSWLDGDITPASPELARQRQWILDHLHLLDGFDLACWCPPGAYCHADVLLAAVAALPVPADLVRLELDRRDLKARMTPASCGYPLYRLEQAIKAHPWLAARRADWRPARKALKHAADSAVAVTEESR